MNLASFERQLALIRQRAGWLRHLAAQGAQRPPEQWGDSLSALDKAIDDLQRAEHALRQEVEDLRQGHAAAEAERQRYRSLFEFAPDGYLVTDPAGIIQEANWAAGILLNAPEDTLVGTPLAHFIPPDEMEAFRAHLSSLEHVNGVREWETCLQPRDYATFHAAITLAPERPAAGRITAVRWLLRDITARKQAAEQVQALNAELEQRVQQRTAQLQTANRQLQAEIEDRRRADEAVRARARQQAVVAGLGQRALVGVELDELMQICVTLVARTLDVEFCRLLELQPDGQSLLVRASYGWPANAAPQLLAPGTDAQAEYTLRVHAPVMAPDLAAEPRFACPDECAAHNVISGLSVAVHGRAGQAWGVLAAHTRRPHAFAADDTNFLVAVANVLSATLERHRSEAEIRGLNASLERRVTERTTELEEKNRELETFTYSVSHDLKAPLRGIDGYSRLLLEDYSGRIEPEGEESLRTIRRAVQQMNQLIDDLLAYSRLERRSLAPSRVDVPDLIDQVLAERSDELQRRAVRLTVDVPGGAVSADRDGLAQALRNLLDNALKFTQHQPQPCIALGGHDDGRRCTLWVRDNGIGFDMQYADRIFGIFQRLHRAETYEGTGIGLAIVNKAMQRMHGRAWAESVPGQGACFYLELPSQPVAALGAQAAPGA